MANGVDTTAPIIKSSAPASGTIVAGTVTISGTATDNRWVSGMRVYIDSVRVKTSSTGSITHAWDTSTAAAGTHTIKIEAFDPTGLLGSRVISVTK
ncbi:MAG: Ig-like domain-containing protein [Bdellovibrionota bacterium]